MYVYCPTCKGLVTERFLTALVESYIILSNSILIALKAMERKEIKWKSKFSSPVLKGSTKMILMSRKLCGEGFLVRPGPGPDLDLLRSPIFKIKLLLTSAKYLRKYVSESTKILLIGSSQNFNQRLFTWYYTFSTTPCSYGCSANRLHIPH